jgi:hypothetical protein
LVKCNRCNQVFFQLPINPLIKLIDSCKSFNHHNTYRNCIGISISIAFTTVPPIIHYPHPQTYLLSSACTTVSSACTTVSSASASASTNCNRIHNCTSYHPHPLTLRIHYPHPLTLSLISSSACTSAFATVSPVIRIHMHNRQLHHPSSHPQFAYPCQLLPTGYRTASYHKLHTGDTGDISIVLIQIGTVS